MAKEHKRIIVALAVIFVSLLSYIQDKEVFVVLINMLMLSLVYIGATLLFCGLVALAVLLVAIILKLIKIVFKRRRF